MEINHPKHYNQYPVEVIDMMIRIWGEEATRTFCILNAFKYRMRVGHKDDAQSDLAKEQWYLDKAEELGMSVEDRINQAIRGTTPKEALAESVKNNKAKRIASSQTDMVDAAKYAILSVLYPYDEWKKEQDELLRSEREQKCIKWWMNKYPTEVNGLPVDCKGWRIASVSCRYNLEEKIDAIIMLENLDRYVVVPDENHIYPTKSRVKTLKHIV